MSLWSTVTHGAATLAGTSYDYLTPGKGQSRVTKWGAELPKPAAPATPPNYGTGTSGSTMTTGVGAPASVAPAYTPAPVPRLATYDYSANWNRALQAAEKAVSPVYAAELNNFIAQQQQTLSEQQQKTTAGKSSLEQALERLKQDTGVQRQRTTEDTATNIADINATQAYNDRTQGLSFDATNRAANENLGASGIAGSGLGQQAVQEGQNAYRGQSNEQVRQSQNKVTAANVLMNRNFQDLATQETRATEDTGAKKTQLDIDLQNFIKDQQLALESEKSTVEAKKQADIYSSAGNYQKSYVNDWIASLRGAGYTPQEVALAAQVYG